MRVKYSAFLVTACAVLFVSGCGRSKNGAGLTGSASDVVGPVTDQLLQGGQRADPAIWPTYGGDWAQTRYSALTDIRRETVQRLRPAWIYQTGILGTFETTPVVLGREMYITTPVSKGRQDVLRLDATTGEVVWRVELTSRGVTNGAPQPFFDLHLPSDFGPNRGVAVYGDRVYVGTLNGTLLALDRRTGHKIFEVATLSPRLTSAPLAARGRIIVGLSWVARGAIQAFNAQTGKELWTWWAIPSPENGGWWGTWTDTLPGFPHVSLGRDIAREKADSARLTDSWKSGGGGAPMTPTFDPESGLLYTSTGHPDPAGFPRLPSHTRATCAGRVRSAPFTSRRARRLGVTSSFRTTSGAAPVPHRPSFSSCSMEASALTRWENFPGWETSTYGIGVTESS